MVSIRLFFVMQLYELAQVLIKGDLVPERVHMDVTGNPLLCVHKLCWMHYLKNHMTLTMDAYP